MVLVSVACAAPTDGPGKAAFDYLQALSARDGDAIWEMLAPETHTRLATLHGTLRTTRALVLAHYPEDLRKEALASSGAAVIEKADTPKALFLRLFAGAGEVAEPDALGRLSLRPRHESTDDAGRTVVRTWGGDDIVLVEVGGRWHVALSDGDQARLDKLAVMAERNLARIRTEVDSVNAKRFGGK